MVQFISVLTKSFYSGVSNGKDRYLERRKNQEISEIFNEEDQFLCDEINNILYWHPDVDRSNIQVSVNNGVVHLLGSVDSLHAKKCAQNAIEDLSGVLKVINDLEVKGTLDIDSDKIISRGDDGLYSEENVPR